MLEKLLISSVMNKHFRAEINFFFSNSCTGSDPDRIPTWGFFCGEEEIFTLDIDKLSE